MIIAAVAFATLCIHSSAQGELCNHTDGGVFVQSGHVLLDPNITLNQVRSTYAWPNATIYYEIDVCYFNETEQQWIHNAMKHIESKSCVSFKKRDNEPNYVAIVNGSGCSAYRSFYGRGQQEIWLPRSECLDNGTILHMLLHAAGFAHESQRGSIQRYLVFNDENVKREEQEDFARVDNINPIHQGHYDPQSIMHPYHDEGGLKKSEWTMKSKVCVAESEFGLARRIGEMTATDVFKLNRFYECEALIDWSTVARHPISCPMDAQWIKWIQKELPFWIQRIKSGYQQSINFAAHEIGGPLCNYTHKPDFIFFDDIAVPMQNRTKRAAIHNDTVRWPDGVIYYEIDTCVFNASHVALILESMNYIQERTCIRFQRRENQTHYLAFIRGNHCGSELGCKQYGLQGLYLDPESCMVKRVIIHELLHTIGFDHEHNRLDRDEHVDIHWDNIVPEKWNNFNKSTTRVNSTMGLPYDPYSIMHYTHQMFTVVGLYSAMTSKDCVPNEHLGWGQKVAKMTKMDVRKVNTFYQCETYLTENFTYHVYSCEEKRKDEERMKAWRDLFPSLYNATARDLLEYLSFAVFG